LFHPFSGGKLPISSQNFFLKNRKCFYCLLPQIHLKPEFDELDEPRVSVEPVHTSGFISDCCTAFCIDSMYRFGFLFSSKDMEKNYLFPNTFVRKAKHLVMKCLPPVGNFFFSCPNWLREMAAR